MKDHYLHIGGMLLLMLIGVSAVVLTSGCTEQVPAPQENPFPGTWVYQGNIGPYNTTIVFTFRENMTGRYDMLVTDVTPPFMNSMEFTWESGGNRLFIGSSSEKQHLDIRYYPDRDRLAVLADNESGVFVGEEFIAGPFAWDFFRVIDKGERTNRTGP